MTSRAASALSWAAATAVASFRARLPHPWRGSGSWTAGIAIRDEVREVVRPVIDLAKGAGASSTACSDRSDDDTSTVGTHTSSLESSPRHPGQHSPQPLDVGSATAEGCCRPVSPSDGISASASCPLPASPGVHRPFTQPDSLSGLARGTHQHGLQIATPSQPHVSCAAGGTRLTTSTPVASHPRIRQPEASYSRTSRSPTARPTDAHLAHRLPLSTTRCHSPGPYAAHLCRTDQFAEPTSIEGRYPHHYAYTSRGVTLLEGGHLCRPMTTIRAH